MCSTASVVVLRGASSPIDHRLCSFVGHSREDRERIERVANVLLRLALSVSTRVRSLPKRQRRSVPYPSEWIESSSSGDSAPVKDASALRMSRRIPSSVRCRLRELSGQRFVCSRTANVRLTDLVRRRLGPRVRLAGKTQGLPMATQRGQGPASLSPGRAAARHLTLACRQALHAASTPLTLELPVGSGDSPCLFAADAADLLRARAWIVSSSSSHSSSIPASADRSSASAMFVVVESPDIYARRYRQWLVMLVASSAA